MKNIISNKTLIQVTTDMGLRGAQEFPTRCTGHTTGKALELIGFVMQKAKVANCKQVSVYTPEREVLTKAVDIIYGMNLVGFSWSRSCFGGGDLRYQPFE